MYSVIYDIDTGLSLESYLELPQIADPQKILACITYFRRGTLSSILSIQAEDDDGNKASKKEPKKVVKKPFTEANFEKAKDANANVEMIEKGYSITPEMIAKYNEFLNK